VVAIRDKNVTRATDWGRSGFDRYLRREIGRGTTTAPEDNHVMLTIRRLDVTQHRIFTCRGAARD